jgi:hypothetical protein
MTPTAFDFTLKMPGDSRLIGAVRQLTEHAADYAKLTPDAGAALAGHVQRATEQAISAAKTPSALIEYRFSADADAIMVAFWTDAAAPSPRPSFTADDVTVDWTMEGSRHICRIRRQL